MRIAFITAGAAGMYCGSCMRDNTLAAALHALGHDAILVPTFTPITTDEADVSDKHIFMGGVNVYLQEKFRLFRHTPRWFDRLLNARWLLRYVSRYSSNTDYSTLGGLTASMLQGTLGHQRKEVARLVAWLKTEAKPDVVLLTNALLSGVVPAIRRELGVPVLTTLQGDDIFLDALPESDRERCIQLILGHDAHTEGYISTSGAYADYMSGYLRLKREKVHVVYPGINTKGHERMTPLERPPTIGYFARIAPEKGFANMIDAFIKLKARPGTEAIQLKYSGWLGVKNQAFHTAQLAKLADAGILANAHHVESPDHASKVRFFQSIDVLSVPTIYHEPKGLYVLEAWANGVPVVQPHHGSFPELIQQTGGGVLIPPNDANALADALFELLADHPRRAELGNNGHTALHERFTAQAMARETVALLERILKPMPTHNPPQLQAT